MFFKYHLTLEIIIPSSDKTSNNIVFIDLKNSEKLFHKFKKKFKTAISKFHFGLF